MRIALALLLLASLGFAQIDVLSPRGRRDPFVDPRIAVNPTDPQPPDRGRSLDGTEERGVVEGPVRNGEEARDRARILAAFEGVKPQIVGLVYCLEEVRARLCIGIGLLGRTTVVDTEVPLPKSNSHVTLRTRGAGQDHSYAEGDRVAAGLYVKRIERNQVAFQYEEETIWVRTTP